jgi:hypothetical protein
MNRYRNSLSEDAVKAYVEVAEEVRRAPHACTLYYIKREIWFDSFMYLCACVSFTHVANTV